MKKISINIDKVIEYLVYFFVFLLPFQTRYIFRYLTLGGDEFEYGKLSIYSSDLVFIAIILLFLFSKVKQIKNIKLTNKFYLIFLFFLICSVNYFFASNIQLYFYYIVKITEIISLLFILHFIKIDFRKLFYFFIISIVFHGILGFSQFFSQNINANKYLGIAQHLVSAGGTSVLENFDGRFLRIYGGFTHPNVFGGFIVIALIFLLILFFTDSISRHKKISFWFLMGFLLEVLFLTFSRSAFLTLFSCLLFLIVFELINKHYKKLFSVLILIFAICLINVFVFKDLIYSRFAQTDRLELKSINERAVLKEQSKEVIKNNWILGVGLGNYIPYVYKNVTSNLDIWDYQPVHNVYSLILSELGILGLISYLSIFIYTIVYRIKKKNYIYLLPIIIVLVINFFDHYFWTSWSGLALSFLLLFIDDLKDYSNEMAEILK